MLLQFKLDCPYSPSRPTKATEIDSKIRSLNMPHFGERFHLRKIVDIDFVKEAFHAWKAVYSDYPRSMVRSGQLCE